MRLYHLSDAELEPGELLLPQQDGYCHWPENRAMEFWLEKRRPPEKLSRADSVFLCPRIPERDMGAAGETRIFLCQADADALSQRSDMNWLIEMDQGLEDPSTLLDDWGERAIRELATGYWSGEPRPGLSPSWEVRQPRALVLACRLTSDVRRCAEFDEMEPQR